MSLQQQIQREIDEEARIDRRIEKIKKRFFKNPINRKYREAKSKDDAHAILIFERNNLSKYSIVLNKEDLAITHCERDPGMVLIYLKSTNPHDTMTGVIGDIRQNHIPNDVIKGGNS